MFNKRIEYAKDKTIPQNIWETVFTKDSSDFIQFYFDRVYKNSNTLVLYANDIPTAHLQMLPFDMTFCDEIVKSSYLSGVSTLPQYRGQGFMEDLMIKSLNDMYQNNVVISTLIPAKPNIYLKYGYRYTFFLYESMLKGQKKLSVLMETTSPAYLNSIYNECYHKFNRILRSAHDWENILYEHENFEKGRVFVIDGAYALVSFNNEIPLIKEIGYWNESVRKKLLSALTAKFGTIQLYSVDGEKEIPFAQSRVIHVEKVLDILRKNKKFEPFTIRINDPYILQNNQSYQVNQEGVTSVEQAEIVMDISDFSQLVMGNINTIKMNEFDNNLKSFFYKKSNYMNLMLN